MIKHVFCLTKHDLFSNAKTIEDVYKTQNKYMHFTDLFLYVPIPKNHIDASVISLYFFNRQAGVASSIKRNFNKIDIFYSTFNRKYICVKETKTLKIKTTLKIT